MKLKVAIYTCLIGLLLYACANRGTPEGGPKDEKGPVVLREEPYSFSTNFTGKNIKVYFDEFLQLKGITEKFVISPPMKKKPKVYLRSKYVLVDLSQDTLRSNTTYSLDFADAITDLNEGNPLGFYRYVFSTGDFIDTMELAGTVVRAESGNPILNMSVFLYENLSDSAAVKEIASYTARTDSSGVFRFTNIKDVPYRVIAVDDANNDYKFTPEGEKVGFLDTIVRPMIVPTTRRDTIRRIEGVVDGDTIVVDSIVTVDFLAYGPSNLYLRVFDEKLTQLYMTNDERKERYKLDFTFSIPTDNKLSVTLKDTTVDNWYIPEYSVGKDSVTLWITDSLVYKKDTLRVIVSYLKTDSLKNLSFVSDTNRYVFKEKMDKQQVRLVRPIKPKKAAKLAKKAAKKAAKLAKRRLKLGLAPLADSDSLKMDTLFSEAFTKDSINIDSLVRKGLVVDSARLEQLYLSGVDSARIDSIKKSIDEATENINMLLLGDKRKKDKQKDEAAESAKFLKITCDASGEFDIGAVPTLSFDRPVRKIGLDSLLKFEVKVDSTYQDVKFEVEDDTIHLRQMRILCKTSPEKEYRITIDSAAIYDIYGRPNKKMETSFKIKAKETYGKISVKVSETKGQNIILQLYKSDGSNSGDKNGESKKKEVGKDYKAPSIVKECKINGDGTAVFDLIKEGKYKIRAIIDANGNGIWDTGIYLKHLQPEEIVYLPQEINVKQNFDVEQAFDVEENRVK